MKYLYKYPQAAFPYDNLVDTSRGRSRHEYEYELLDTGVFEQDRYFDVFIEYAKESPEDILIEITVYGGTEKFQTDPHWRDLILFYEYFHGDNGAGLGASHQTGWTGIIPRGMHLFATTSAEQIIQLGKMAAVIDVNKPRSAEFAGVGK